LPFPPYVVPSNENNAVFCDNGNNWPSHHAQPLGAKLNGKILISATNGSAMMVSLMFGYQQSAPKIERRDRS
jgi:hypothetical protein